MVFLGEMLSHVPPKIWSLCLIINLVCLLCSGSSGGRDEWSPVLLHPPFLHPWSGCVGSGRTDGLRALERKQTQTFLLIREQLIYIGFQNVCLLINIRHKNAKTATALLNHTIRLSQWTAHGFETTSQENINSQVEQEVQLWNIFLMLWKIYGIKHMCTNRDTVDRTCLPIWASALSCDKNLFLKTRHRCCVPCCRHQHRITALKVNVRWTLTATSCCQHAPLIWPVAAVKTNQPVDYYGLPAALNTTNCIKLSCISKLCESQAK